MTTSPHGNPLPGAAALDVFVVEGDLGAIADSITGRTALRSRSTDVSEER
jgi:hypothetical protein